MDEKLKARNLLLEYKCKKSRYRNGLIESCYWVNKNNKLEGEYKAWHENRKIFIHDFYKNGKLHGERKIWYPSGQIRTHGFWKNGLKEGEFKSWDLYGKLEVHCIYKNNKKVE